MVFCRQLIRLSQVCKLSKGRALLGVFRFQTEPLLCCCIIFSSAFCPAVGLPVACADGCLPAGCSLADGGNSLGDACSALALSLRSAASPAQREERPPKRASVQCKDSKGCPARPQPERASPAAIARPRHSAGRAFPDTGRATRGARCV